MSKVDNPKVDIDIFFTLKQDLESHKRNINKAMVQLIPFEDDEESKNLLTNSMRYSLLSGGKKYRSFCLNLIGNLFAIGKKRLLLIGCAIEMIHTYIAIHDDLPLMDNDDYRHGQLSSHKRFDDSTALITGDSLLLLAFQIISNDELLKFPKEQKCEIINILSRYVGKDGILNGQLMSMSLKKTIPTKEEIMRLNKLKICSLFIVAAEIIITVADIKEKEANALKSYANNIGLLTKIYNDLEYGNQALLFSKESVDIELLTSQAKLLTDQSVKILNVFDKEKKIPLCNFVKFIYHNILQKVSQDSKIQMKATPANSTRQLRI